MVGRQPTRGRSAAYAWLITGPLALVSVVVLVVLWLRDPQWYEAWPLGLPLFVANVAAYVGVFNFTIRQSVFMVSLTDIPLLLAFHHLPPVMVVAMNGATMMVGQLRVVTLPVKRWFNIVKSV